MACLMNIHANAEEAQQMFKSIDSNPSNVKLLFRVVCEVWRFAQFTKGKKSSDDVTNMKKRLLLVGRAIDAGNEEKLVVSKEEQKLLSYIKPDKQMVTRDENGQIIKIDSALVDELSDVLDKILLFSQEGKALFTVEEAKQFGQKKGIE